MHKKTLQLARSIGSHLARNALHECEQTKHDGERNYGAEKQTHHAPEKVSAGFKELATGELPVLVINREDTARDKKHVEKEDHAGG